MQNKNFESYHFFPTTINVLDWDSFLLKGNDVKTFLQGQLTNNVAKLKENSFQITTRLDRGGRLKGFALLVNDNGSFYLLCPQNFSKNLVEDLNKYIIMEDVEIVDAPNWKDFTIDLNQNKRIKGHINSFEFSISTGSEGEVNNAGFDYLAIMGFPILGENIEVEQLVTDSILNDSAFDLDKGCYLGQEAVNKIKSNRGSNKYPVVLISNDEDIKLSIGQQLFVNDELVGKVTALLMEKPLRAVASLKREYRVEKKEYNFKDVGRLRIAYIPYFKELTLQDKSSVLYEKAIALFNQNREIDAEQMFRQSIALNPHNNDAIESLGVLMGRLNKFEEGIELMDELLKNDPDSVMAHTNKSLFLMKLGKIEEAEEEKSLATVSGFKQFGDEAEFKRKQEEELEKEKADFKRKREMFLQVLEIDPTDEIALSGMAEVSIFEKDYEASVGYLESLLKNAPNNPKGNLMLAKVYLEGGQVEKIDSSRLEELTKLSAKKGDLKTANEIQMILDRL